MSFVISHFPSSHPHQLVEFILTGLPATGTLLSIQLCILLLHSFFQGAFPSISLLSLSPPQEGQFRCLCRFIFTVESQNASSSVPCSNYGTLLSVFKHELLFPPFAYVVPLPRGFLTLQQAHEDPTGSPLELSGVGILSYPFSDSA